MIKFLPAGALLIAIAACNSNPQPAATTNPLDTAGLAQYQLNKLRGSELDSVRTQPVTAAYVTPAPRPRAATATRSTASSGSSGSNGSTTGSGAGTTVATPEKKGISKTAKGAIIGGVAGAAGGALINKKNRGAGAIIGGVVGAGAGAIIGRQADKKDGRN
ncbi:MAG: glycine zipper 2TM domain-containing protein [Chitinophagaceae bacterium]|nr:MAG: glycine zipper 2TM domain-containing protein [Chitinophagaceae bacterium]